MQSTEDYLNYKSPDFAGDESFQEWVRRPNEDNEKFWNKFLSDHPGKKMEIEEAVTIIGSIHFKEEWPEEKTVELFLNKAIFQINQKSKGKGKVVTFYRWCAAAAILVILGSVAYFLMSRNSVPHAQLAAKKNQIHDIAPGGNRAILTLANGSTIILDSANNGVLTEQGNSKVIKVQSGKVSYQDKQNDNVVKVEYNTVTTPRGGQYQLQLADGSQVWLNAASSITFPTSFTGNERTVSITGEAYFEVSHNAAKPFHVIAHGVNVEVLGTHFNIMSYSDEENIKTTLLEGSVKVSNDSMSVKISPGQQAVLNNSSNDISIQNNIDLEETVAWKNGKFIFHNADIKNIMHQLERWYNVSASFNTNVTKEEFEGIISRNVNLSQILAMLEKTGVVKVTIDGRNMIVN